MGPRASFVGLLALCSHTQFPALLCQQWRPFAFAKGEGRRFESIRELWQLCRGCPSYLWQVFDFRISGYLAIASTKFSSLWFSCDVSANKSENSIQASISSQCERSSRDLYCWPSEPLRKMQDKDHPRTTFVGHARYTRRS